MLQMSPKKLKPLKTIPLSYKDCTYEQLIELIVYAQEELLKRGTVTSCKEDTIRQKFIRG